MLKDEECRYGTPCTGFSLNEMNYTVYNLRGVGLCMASRAIYNTALCYFAMLILRARIEDPRFAGLTDSRRFYLAAICRHST